VWILTPSLSWRGRRAPKVARKSSAVSATSISYSPFISATSFARGLRANPVHLCVFLTPDTQTAVSLRRSPGEHFSPWALGVVSAGAPLIGPDTSPGTPRKVSFLLISSKQRILSAGTLGRGLECPTWLVWRSAVSVQAAANCGAHRDVILRSEGLGFGEVLRDDFMSLAPERSSF
jgi:hypothetical protein